MFGGVRPARAIVFFALLMPACLSFGDLMGGSSDDAGSIDASTDAGADVAQPDGAIDDAAIVVDAAHFCAGHETAIFCADFDESDAAQFGFTGAQIDDAGFFQIDNTASVSPPGSFQAGSFPLAAGKSSADYVSRGTTVMPDAGVTIEFDVRADQLPTSGSSIESAALVFVSPTRSSLQFNLTSSTAVVGEEIVQLDGGKEFIPHYLTNPLEPGAWTHITIDLNFAGTKNVSVVANGTSSVASTSLNPAFVVGPLTIDLGNLYTPGPTSAASVHFDNFVVTPK